MFLTYNKPLQIFCSKPAKRKWSQKKTTKENKENYQSSTYIFENEEVKLSMLWFEGEEENLVPCSRELQHYSRNVSPATSTTSQFFFPSTSGCRTRNRSLVPFSHRLTHQCASCCGQVFLTCAILLLGHFWLPWHLRHVRDGNVVSVKLKHFFMAVSQFVREAGVSLHFTICEVGITGFTFTLFVNSHLFYIHVYMRVITPFMTKAS